MATYLGELEIGPILPVEFGGKYDIKSVKLEDDTQELKITTREEIDIPLNKNLEIVKVTLDEIDIPVAKGLNFEATFVNYDEEKMELTIDTNIKDDETLLGIIIDETNNVSLYSMEVN